MSFTHEEMIRDHERINARADLLLNDLRTMQKADAGKAAYALYDLANVVRNHLAKEGQMVAEAADNFAQTLAWRRIERLHGNVRNEWNEFLKLWNLVTISCHWPEFRLRARKMLTDLQTRVHVETEQIYTPALRMGMLQDEPRELAE